MNKRAEIKALNVSEGGLGQGALALNSKAGLPYNMPLQTIISYPPPPPHTHTHHPPLLASSNTIFVMAVPFNGTRLLSPESRESHWGGGGGGGQIKYINVWCKHFSLIYNCFGFTFISKNLHHYIVVAWHD